MRTHCDYHKEYLHREKATLAERTPSELGNPIFKRSLRSSADHRPGARPVGSSASRARSPPTARHSAKTSCSFVAPSPSGRCESRFAIEVQWAD